MISYKDLHDLIQTLFKEVGDTMDTEFLVLTYGDYLDDVSAHEITHKNLYPVYATMDAGQYEAIPNVDLQSFEASVNIYFPTSEQNNLFLFLSALNQKLIGQIVSVNDKSVVLNRGVEAFGTEEKIETLVDNAFHIKEMTYNHDHNLTATDEWGVCSFKLYGASCLNMNSENGFAYGNQIETTLSIKVNGTTFSSVVYTPSITSSSTGSMSAQQGTTESSTAGVNSTSTYGSTFPCYYQNNAFWNTIIALDENQTLLQNYVIRVEKKYKFLGDITYISYVIVSDLAKQITLGKPIVYAFTFTKAIALDINKQWGTDL